MDYGALNSHPILIYLHHNMAQTSIHHIPIHESIHRRRLLPVFVAVAALFLLLQATTVTPADRSFTVELIHQYSKRSPLYDGNLTQSQLLKRLVDSSRSRLQWLESSTSLGGSGDTNAIRPLLKVDGLVYLVLVTIGTGQGMRPYHLAFDTGSSLTWTPCEPCESCFDQRGQRFDPAHSPTYSPLLRTDRLCDKPDGNGRCTFRVDYAADGSFTQGILSRDTFTFPSDSGGHDEPVGGVVFGCAHSAALTRKVWNSIDGVMGMGMAPASLPTQLHSLIDGHFSYCLVPPGTQTAGFLRFGRNHVHRGPLVATPITWYSNHGRYHLQLEGVSINGRRLNLPPETFALHDDDHGGCIIDTGFPTSVLIKAAYDEASNVLREHFQHLRRVDGKDKGYSLELCYETPRNYASVLPYMTLHFRGADYHVGNEKLFTVNHRFFCWMMHGSDQYTVLGSYQQYNVRFLYDIQSRMLSFGPENCALESGH